MVRSVDWRLVLTWNFRCGLLARQARVWRVSPNSVQLVRRKQRANGQRRVAWFFWVKDGRGVLPLDGH